MFQVDHTNPTHPHAAASRQPIAVELLAVLFLFLGLVSFGGLLLWIATTEAIVNSPLTARDLTWNFVRTLGIVRPALLLLAGGLQLRLSLRLRNGELGGLRWARLLSNWALVIAIGLLLYIGTQAIRAADATTRTVFVGTLPFALIVAAAGAVRAAVIRSTPYFSGDEDITSRQTRLAWNLLVPTLIVFLAIAVSPLERVFITSLTDERFASSDAVNFVGLENYNRLWSVRVDVVPCTQDANTGECLTETDEFGNEHIVYPRPRRYYPEDSEYVTLRYRDFASFTLRGRHFVLSARDVEFVESLVTSLYYTVLAVFFQFAIGLGIALILAQRLRGIGVLRVVMLVPMAIPTLIATQFWDVMLRPDATGVINAALMSMGAVSEPQQWLLNPALQVPTLVAVIVWKETPITALLLLPGLVAIPRETYQAAAIDGANRLQRFWYVTLPMLRPTLGVVLVLRTMLFIRVFDLFEILVGRTRFVLATYAHDALIQRQQLGYSSAISVTIFLVTMLFTLTYMHTLQIDEA